LNKRKGDSSFKALAELLEEGGDGFYVQLILGRAHAELGDRERALEALRKARQRRPNHSEVAKPIAELTDGTR